MKGLLGTLVWFGGFVLGMSGIVLVMVVCISEMMSGLNDCRILPMVLSGIAGVVLFALGDWVMGYGARISVEYEYRNHSKSLRWH